MIFLYDPWQAWIVDLDSLLSTDWQELVNKTIEYQIEDKHKGWTDKGIDLSRG